MITLTNTFHNTAYELHKKSGDHVSLSTWRRINKTLCGIKNCTCGGIRGGKNYIEPAIDAHGNYTGGTVIDGSVYTADPNYYVTGKLTVGK